MLCVCVCVCVLENEAPHELDTISIVQMPSDDYGRQLEHRWHRAERPLMKDLCLKKRIVIIYFVG